MHSSHRDSLWLRWSVWITSNVECNHNHIHNTVNANATSDHVGCWCGAQWWMMAADERHPIVTLAPAHMTPIKFETMQMTWVKLCAHDLYAMAKLHECDSPLTTIIIIIFLWSTVLRRRSLRRWIFLDQIRVSSGLGSESVVQLVRLQWMPRFDFAFRYIFGDGSRFNLHI